MARSQADSSLGTERDKAHGKSAKLANWDQIVEGGHIPAENEIFRRSWKNQVNESSLDQVIDCSF